METALLLVDWQSDCQNCNGCVKLCIEEAASVSVAATLKITRAGQPHDPVPPLCLSGLAEQGLPQYVSMVPARAPWSGAVRALGQQTTRRHHPAAAPNVLHHDLYYICSATPHQQKEVQDLFAMHSKAKPGSY